MLNLIRCRLSSEVFGDNDEVWRYKRKLPCGCVLHWDEKETMITFCISHSSDYVRWTGNDEEFIKTVINSQREIQYLDDSLLAKMR